MGIENLNQSGADGSAGVAGSARSFIDSLLKAWADPGMPAVGFGLLCVGPAKGDIGMVFERTCDSS